MNLDKAKKEAEELFDSMKGFRVKHTHSRKCAIIAQTRVIKTLKKNGIDSEFQNNVLEQLKIK